MGRPPKDKSQLMNVALRIMVTADQKRLIDQALELDKSEFAAWARPILLEAARRRLATTGPGKVRRKKNE